ncbi:transposase IS66 family protein [Shigella flexneri 6603-63]|nr:transposase IS66 family protein [Shigella flexneri 6603-63]
MKVLAPGNGKTKTGRLWVYVRDDRNAGSSLPAAVWFAYSADRQRRTSAAYHLGQSIEGVLQADAYAGYNVLYETGRVKEAGLPAHARRKIHDEDVRRPTEMTQEALRRIAELYDIEAEIRGSPAEERLAVRKARSVQLMQSLYDWIQLQRKTLSKHAEMAKAFDYILNHWNALNEFCRDGWVEIDNNIGENALRSVAVGRKIISFSAQTREEKVRRSSTVCWSPANRTKWSRRTGCAK